jgi:uncharacterized protein (DUF697 family)
LEGEIDHMASLKDLTNAWKNIREFDLRPLRETALRPVKIALVGAIGSGRHTLLDQMRNDESGSAGDALRAVARTPAVIATPETASSIDAIQVEQTDLIILVSSTARREDETERLLIRRLSDSGKKTLVFINRSDTAEDNDIAAEQAGTGFARTVYGSALDRTSLLKCFIPAVLASLPDQHLALGRQFPMFRQEIARQLIDDTCRANAAYALGAGLAEVVPVLDLPFNIADMVVLTKAQAFLAYKLGLTLGFSTRWHDYVTEFGSVIGGGFLWRQIARQLVGLIPVWGIVPKVAVAYAGTFVVGNTVLQWYLTGRHISKKRIHELYLEAFSHGRRLAVSLIEKAPRMLRKRRTKTTTLIEEISLPKSKRLKIGLRGKKDLPAPLKNCSRCGRDSAADALFCQYCGMAFDVNETTRS